MLEVVFVAILLCSSVVTWTVLIARRRAGEPWLAYAPRRPVPWGVLDVLFALLLLVVLTSVAVAVARPRADPQRVAAPSALDLELTANDILAQAIASLAVLAISLVTTRVRYRATGADLGWSTAHFAADLRLGVVAFLTLAPPVYVVQLILVQWFASKHPLIELIRHNPEPRLVAICGVSAVLVAPVIEEYLFRGLLQGWLERLAADWRWPPPTRRHEAAGPAAEGMGRGVLASMAFPRSTPDADTDNPYQPPAPGGHGDAARARDSSQAAPKAPYWPIVCSALGFAVMHLSHGPDWIPLFLLALGLGYLYRQTHRLVPVIVVHFLLNACSMAMLLVS